MSDTKVKLVNICPVFISPDVKRTVEFYTEKLGFKYAAHYDKADNFATIYRDSIEIVIVQSKYGNPQPNIKIYGNGYDAYIDPDTVGGVDVIYNELISKGVKIITEPRKTDYGSYEFVFEDIDGRQIGVGRIKDDKTYFKNSDVNE
jgi:catechol 2,3-dioxygenase-like lactoylglutathione lyase family enzyme